MLWFTAIWGSRVGMFPLRLTVLNRDYNGGTIITTKDCQLSSGLGFRGFPLTRFRASGLNMGGPGSWN